MPWSAHFSLKFVENAASSREKNHFPIEIFFDEWRRAWVWEGERKAEASSHSPTLQKEKKNGFRLYRFIVLFSSSSLSSCSCWQRSFNAHGLISSWYCFRFLFISIHIHKQYTVSVRICCMNANEPKKDEAKKSNILNSRGDRTKSNRISWSDDSFVWFFSFFGSLSFCWRRRRWRRQWHYTRIYK